MQVPQVVNSVRRKFDDFDNFTVAVDNFVDDLDTFGNLSAELVNYQVPGTNGTTSGNTSFFCADCEDFANDVADAIEEVHNQTGPIMDNITDVINSTGDTLDAAEANFTGMVDSFKQPLISFENNLTSVEDEIDKYVGYMQRYDGYRLAISGLIFSIPMGVFFLFVIGGLLKARAVFYYAYHLTFLSMTLSFTLLALHLPLATLFADLCVQLDYYDQDFSRIPFDQLQNGTNDSIPIGEILNSALSGEPIAGIIEDTYNISFDAFKDQIEFPAFDTNDTQNAYDNFSIFDDLANKTQNLTLESYNFTLLINLLLGPNPNYVHPFPAVQDPALLPEEERPGINDWIKFYAAPPNDTDVFDRNSSVNITPTDYYWVDYPLYSTFFGVNLSVIIQEQLDALNTAIASDFAIQVQIDALKSNMTALQYSADVLKASLYDLISVADNIPNLIEPVLHIVDIIEANANIKFVGDGYKAMKAAWCNDFVGALAGMSLAYSMIGLLSIVIVICALLLENRMGLEKVAGFEDIEAAVEMQPMNPGGNTGNMNSANMNSANTGMAGIPPSSAPQNQPVAPMVVSQNSPEASAIAGPQNEPLLDL